MHRVSLSWEHVEDDIGRVTEVEPGLFTIKIDPSFRAIPSHAKIVLLHEMLHLSVWPRRTHGKAWKQGRQKLWTAGAYDDLV